MAATLDRKLVYRPLSIQPKAKGAPLSARAAQQKKRRLDADDEWEPLAYDRAQAAELEELEEEEEDEVEGKDKSVSEEQDRLQR